MKLGHSLSMIQLDFITRLKLVIDVDTDPENTFILV